MTQIIDDLSEFSDQEIAAMTALGESESLGEAAMQGTLCVVMNRAAANISWMGGSDIRSVCLQRDQFDVWWPQTGNKDRDRVICIARNNPSYAPYLTAMSLAADLLAGTLTDITNGAVSYGDNGEKPAVHDGSQPCFTQGNRVYYDLEAVL